MNKTIKYMTKYISPFILILSLFLSSYTIQFQNIPSINKMFIKYVEENGKRIAPSYKETNCVRFMDVLLTELFEIDDLTSKSIYINYDEKYIKKMLKRDSSAVSGVCFALVNCNHAEWVSPENAKPGDIIQYWSTTGFLHGHCGIIYGEDQNGFVLLSSHPDSQGFGKMSVNNKLDKNMIMFIVRLKKFKKNTSFE